MVSKEVIAKVLGAALSKSSHSWEWGTAAEASLEWKNADASIWNNPFPNNQVPKLNVGSTEALSYIKGHIELKGKTLTPASGAAGDPAALGVSAIMIGQSDKKYFDAATRQKDHLLKDVPRWNNDPKGAISHRENVAELWADFTYMVPPFLAYYGVAANDVSVLKEAANQYQKYNDVLESQLGVWQHIIGPETSDPWLWSTGNAWAVGGMSRVLATMKKSKFNGQTQSEQGMLMGLIKQIIDGAIKLDVDNSGLLRNYLNDSAWFGEISGTSLIAATAFRMAKLDSAAFGKEYTDWAVKKKEAVDSHINQGNGIVSPAVNPEGWQDKNKFTTGSPEGQSFVVLMYAAYRDWKGGK